WLTAQAERLKRFIALSERTFQLPKKDSRSVQTIIARQRSNPGGWADSGSLRRFSLCLGTKAETLLTRRNS
ncbi:hypothetical protein, partial [Bradyrhizobium tunisiense]|uniref:hypothetical protein n=1 Tax=Bradyrhizobium tunisiense TaxID=3278709 RepID=UPI0035D5D578